MLASRAGEPSWGPEILIRHQLVGIVDSLPDFYGQWEQWSAELSESHTTYPVLLLFRSPDPWSSWVIALLSVLDAELTAPDLPSLLKRVLEITATTFGAQMGVVLLRDSEAEVLRVGASVGLSGEVEEDFAVRPGEGFSGSPVEITANDSSG